MTEPLTVAALRAALGTASAEDGGAAARVTRALEAIGWRGGDVVDAADVAQEIVPSIASCVRDHGNLGIAYREIAEVLRGSGPALDGSLPPVHDYMPAAAEILRGFVAGGR